MNQKILFSAGETLEYSKQYVQQQIAYLKLEITEKLVKATSLLVTWSILGLLSLVFILMLSLAAGFWLSSVLGSYSLAFLSVSGFYLILGFIVFFAKRKLITRPVSIIILKNLSE